jgi:hypothetical protein
VLLAGQKLEGEELLELAAVQADRRRPAEVIQGHAVLEAGSGQATFERLVVSALDLVSQEQRQEAA